MAGAGFGQPGRKMLKSDASMARTVDKVVAVTFGILRMIYV
jgi:hypothetical protein